MEKISKVTNVTGNGSWDSQYGKLYKFEVFFENGDVGDYNSKLQEQTSFVVGQEATYELTAKEFQGRTFYTVKPVKKQQAYGGYAAKPADPEKDKKIARMSVLKCATDLVVNKVITLDNLFGYAKFMEAYVEKGIDPFKELYNAELEKQVAQESVKGEDGLPF
jgi:hypothetical protein